MPQDLSGRDLKNCNFQGQDLRLANFQHADIRGADFSGSNLYRANFYQVKAGLPPQRVIRLLVFSVFLALGAGIITAYAGVVFGTLFALDQLGSIVVGLCVGAILCIFGITTVCTGISSALGVASLISAMGVVVGVALVPDSKPASQLAFSTLILGGSLAGIVGLAIAIRLLNHLPLGLGVAVFGIILGTALGINQDYAIADFVGVVLISTTNLVLAAYIAACSRNDDDPRYQLIRTLLVQLKTFGGTSFRQSNLTETNFTEAHLSGTDFRKSRLTRVAWRNSQLEEANFHQTPLEDSSVRRLLTGGKGEGETLERMDLRGANLEGANLISSNLMGADLSNANLRNTSFERANLVQARLYGADLSSASLTGAFIQNWGISSETIFDDVQCDYIHMRLPTDQDPDPCRKPDNKSETFRPGDFADFIAPIIRTLDSYQQQNLDPRNLLAPKTLDLYHYEGIDPSAAAITLQQLIETNPQAEIEVRAIEGRGYQKVRIQAQIANSADPSQLNADYFDRYNSLQTLAHPDLSTMLDGIAAKDSQIRSLESMVKNALGSDRFYVEPTKPQNILILAANPRDSSRLRIDEEVREIQNGLDRARNRDKFLLQQRWAITVRELRRALLDCKPRIVHFSGHGLGSSNERLDSQFSNNQLGSRQTSSPPETDIQPEGLMLEDEQGNIKLVSGLALASLFEIFADDIDCLVLNACYSETQANAIVQHIPYVIGMNKAIGDRAAIEFSIGFYDGLLAGQAIETAFKLGCNAIQLQGIPEHLTPVLKRKTEA